MAKTKVFFLIIVCVIAAWLFDVLVGRSLTAKLSTLPVLNRFKILSPQAPIVITNRETVRVSDGTDMVLAASQIKSKLSSVVWVNGNSASLAGTAINLSSDGSFVTGAGTFGAKTGNYFVVLNDGRQAQISQSFTDPATSLVFFKAAVQNVPVAPIGTSGDLAPAEKLILAQTSLQDFSITTENIFVGNAQSDTSGKLFQSDLARKSFSASLPQALTNGEAAVNTNAEIVGIYNGSVLISSDVLKQAMALYFGQPQIIRPSFGFSYSIISQNESKLTGQIQGALVKDVASPSAAHTTGLLAGDVITAVDEKNITNNLEDILQSYKPGDKIVFSVTRKGQTISLNLTAGELK